MALIILGDASSIGSLHNIIVPYKDQYRIGWGHGGVVIGNTIDNRLFSTGTVVLAGTNVTIGTSALGARQYLNLSVADPSAAANYVSAGDYISLSTAGAGTTISVTGLQPAGPYVTTAADPYHDHGGIAHAIGSIGGTIGTYTTNSAPGTFCGWSLSIPSFLTTAALSNHGHTNYAGLGASTGTTAGTDIKATLDVAGLSLRTPRFITTAAPVNHIHGVITTMSTTGSVMSYTSNSGGLTLGVPQWLTTLPGGGGGNNLTLAGNTSGTLTPFSAGTVTIAGGDNITLSQDGNAFTIIGAASGTGAGIVASMGTANTTGTKALISTGTLYIEGGNNITVSQQNNTLRIIGGSVAPGTASNAVHAGNNISLSTQGVNTTISVVGLQPTTNMSLYQQTSNMSLYQLTAQNTASLGTTYTSHTHSNLYIPLANTSRYAGTNAAMTGGSITLNTSGASINIQERSLRFIDSHGVSWGSAVNGYTTSVTASVEAGINSSLLGSIYFNDANGVTWGSATSGNSTTITASVNTVGGGTGGVAIRGSGTYVQNTGTVRFANSNGLTFGLSNGIMTASVANNAGSMYFSDANGVSFGVSTNANSQSTITASFSGGGTMSGEYAGTAFSTVNTTGANIRGSVNTAGISLSVPNYVTRTGSLLFANNSGNITWSSNVNNNTTYVYGSAPVGSGSGTYDVSHTHGNVSGINISATSASNGLTLSVPTYLTTAALSNHSHGNVSLALTNLSATASSRSNGLTLSLSANPSVTGGAAQTGISGIGASNTTYTSGTVILSGQANVTVGTSVTGGSQYVRLSVRNFLTTAAQSNHSHGAVSLALTNLSGTASSRSNGMTLSLSVPPASGGGGVALRGSGTYIQSTGTVQFLNSNGITFGLNNNQMTASVANNVGSMYFSDANGVSFGVSSNTNNQSTITASFDGVGSHTHPYMGTSVSVSGNITAMGNTAGLSVTAPVLGHLYFSNAVGHSWSSSISGVSTSVWIYTANT